MLSNGRKTSISKQELTKIIDECSIAAHYLGITKLPVLMKSPLRDDNHPSFGLYTRDGQTVYYIDFATGDKGSLFELLGKIWSVDYNEVINRIYSAIITKSDVDINLPQNALKKVHKLTESTTRLECKTREWKDYDITYWNSYGISLDWLKYADVYPISHKIIIKDGKRMVFPADKYAYTYVEFKEGKITHKFYQPFNKDGFKWQNNHDRSVVSLWTKIPETGDIVCICSSLKDALCLWANTGIPSIAIQGEGYPLSQTAINELKTRFKKQYILLDNDLPGRKDAEKLSQLTGFTNIELPQFEGGKDISDAFKVLGRRAFIKLIRSLFNINNNGLERN